MSIVESGLGRSFMFQESDRFIASDATADILIKAPPEAKRFRFPNLLSQFIYKRSYSRWIESEQRREVWPETVARYIGFIAAERQIPPHILKSAYYHMLSLGVMPSMRALWSAGPSIKRDNTCVYNCAFVGIDSLKSFNEILFILMQGTGIGFSVENKFTDRLPVVAPINGRTKTFVVPDTTEGWCDALYFGLTNWFAGNKVDYDYSLVRPKGAILKTKEGRASGPDPLQKLLEMGQKTVLGASGRHLRPIECHDIVCQIAQIVIAGGNRMSSLISFSDVYDKEMRHAKDFTQGQFPSIRYQANNSAFYEARPDAVTFWQEWDALAASGSGERGFSIDNWHRYAPRPRGMLRSNPCHEIGLRFSMSDDPITGDGGGGQFCNLTAVVMRAHDTEQSLIEKIKVATWLGVIQATFTHFPYLRPKWKEHCDEDRLLGVDITGQCDNPKLANDPGLMKKLNQVAISTAREASSHFGINVPAAICCGKPSGNSSQFVDCSSGFHSRYSDFYFRHVRIPAMDPLCRLIRDQGIPVFPEVGQEDRHPDDVETWVARFPVASPAHAMTRADENPIEQCNRYLRIMKSWCSERGHNQSATIYVKDGEWQKVGEWLWDHFEEVNGLSFLPYDGGSYTLAPYQAISRDVYEKEIAQMPKVDFDDLSRYEREDRTTGDREFACTSGKCEL